MAVVVENLEQFLDREVTGIESRNEVRKYIKEAVAAEREHCAKACDEIADDCKKIAEHAAVLAAMRCAAAIRKGSER